MRLPLQPGKDGSTVRSNSTKVRVVATVDRNLCLEMERIHEQEIEQAKAEDRTEPNWSNTVEMIFRKGIRCYRLDCRASPPVSK